jgi:hypothetical protein
MQEMRQLAFLSGIAAPAANLFPAYAVEMDTKYSMYPCKHGLPGYIISILLAMIKAFTGMPSSISIFIFKFQFVIMKRRVGAIFGTALAMYAVEHRLNA